MELSELVSGVDDITDPASMEKLLIKLDEVQTEDDNFMQILIDKVKDLPVTWPQPWYQISRSLTRPLDPVAENESESFQTDSFTKEENEILAKNWKKFRKTFRVPDKPDSFARWRNRIKSRNPITDVEKTRHFVTAFLAQNLERNLYQVYKHFVSQYAAPVKGAYSQAEEKIMDICFYHHPKKAVPYLSTILGREPRGISKRLQLLHKGKLEKKKLKWKLPIATKFVKSLMLHSKLPLFKLKNARFDTSVWLKVQEDMDHDYHYIQKHWYTFLHVQLFVKYDIKLQRLRKSILKRLKKSYNVWTDIRWKELLQKFPDGFTHGFLYRAVFSLVRTHPNYRTEPLSEVVEIVLKRLKSKKSRYEEKRLQTLQLDEEGNLQIVKYNEEMP